MVATGQTIPWEEMRSYLEDRVARKQPLRPTPRKLTCRATDRMSCEARELAIERRPDGCVALYRYMSVIKKVFVSQYGVRRGPTTEGRDGRRDSSHPYGGMRWRAAD